MMTKISKNKNQSTTPSSQIVSTPKTTSPHVVSTEVNAVQSSESLGGKKKGQNKSKKYENQQEGNKTQNPDAEPKNKRKENFPYLIYGGDHFTKECPRHDEVS